MSTSSHNYGSTNRKDAAASAQPVSGTPAVDASADLVPSVGRTQAAVVDRVEIDPESFGRHAIKVDQLDPARVAARRARAHRYL